MPEGMEYPRDVFERGIVACGLHVGGAKALWDAYTEFERAVLNSLQEMQQNNPEEAAVVQQVWVGGGMEGYDITAFRLHFEGGDLNIGHHFIYFIVFCVQWSSVWEGGETVQASASSAPHRWDYNRDDDPSIYIEEKLLKKLNQLTYLLSQSLICSEVTCCTTFVAEHTIIL